MPKTVKTTCPYCGVGCGVLATQNEDGSIAVKGDPDHPANFGKLCSKGMNLHETVGLDDRLLYPQINGERVSWTKATQTVADKFSQVITDHGPDAVAFYVSGQLLSEDYYVANKLMKGFIGSANIDTNSRLCMSSAVAGHKRAFGTDTVPVSYKDLDTTDLAVLIGSNMAWCHPILFQRLRKNQQERGAKIVVIDPRSTASCDNIDLHLPLKPGSDVMLFNGLLAYLDTHGATDNDFVLQYTEGCKNALQNAKDTAGDINTVATYCDLDPSDLETFYELFLQTPKSLSIFSQGVNQSSQGVDKVNSIINCHLLTGRIGTEGTGPFSITGQPNAMGGREVGGLANTLAAHMDFDTACVDRISRFWGTDKTASQPGLKAIDLFDAIHDGKIKAVWIMATNPAVSLPDSEKVRQALDKCEFVVVSEAIQNTDTTQFVDVLLPAATWGERNGTVTNSERRISRQHALIELPGEALPDWKIITHVAQKLGLSDNFSYQTSFDIFKEHVALSQFENNGSRDFDLSLWMDMDESGFDALSPTQWPVNQENPNGKERFFAKGSFFTRSQKGQFIATQAQAPINETDGQYPLILNTGRVRDHWHTMTRTGKSPRLASHIAEPFVQISPTDAQKFGVAHDDLAQITSRWGKSIFRVNISPEMREGEIFCPIHWTDQNAQNSVVSRIVNPVADPLSGQPESKHTPVRIEPFDVKWHGFLLSRKEIETDNLSYWCRAQSQGCYVYDIAGNQSDIDWTHYAKMLFGDGDVLSLEDVRRHQWRTAIIENDKVQGIILVAEGKGALPHKTWLEEVFLSEKLDDMERTSLLAATAPSNANNAGPIVCSCFGIGMNTIVNAIKDQTCLSVDAIGEVLQAGTNCGSCIPDLKALLERTASDKASRL